MIFASAVRQGIFYGIPLRKNSAPASICTLYKTSFAYHPRPMKLFIYRPSAATPEQFVAYWSALYNATQDNTLYAPVVGQALTAEVVHQLFVWKNGSRLSGKKWRSVEDNYIARLEELRALPLDTNAETFLGRFSKGGAIWRIFWLHCWQPERFPIYDQHVHRAMSYIRGGRCEEINTWSDHTKISAYLHRYLPFYESFAGLEHRSVDRALWSFGKFVKNSRFPDTASRHAPGTT